MKTDTAAGFGAAPLLALETSGRAGSVALTWGDTPGSPALREIVLDPERGSAQTLAPAIEELLRGAQVRPDQLGCLAIARGPGSFTGLRVGAATAKTLAWALGIPLVAVDTLDVITRQLEASRLGPRLPLGPSEFHVGDRLWSVIDAYRGQLFAAGYRWTGEHFEKDLPTGIQDIADLASRIVAGSEEAIWVVGPGATKLQKAWQDQAHPREIVWMHEGPAMPTASTVAKMGWTEWQTGRTEEVLGFLPSYYRSSAAEEKRSGLKRL